MEQKIWEHALQPRDGSATGPIAPLRVGSWNLENFDAVPKNFQGFDRAAKIAHTAETIVNGLHSPHILALQEIAGDTITLGDEPVSAANNMQELIEAIYQAGGPLYQYCEIAPANGADGGMPLANIRNGFLYRPDRVGLHETPSHSSTALLAQGADLQVHLASANPALIAPEDAAYHKARKPLIAEFVDKLTAEHYFITNVHFTSNPHLYNPPSQAQIDSGEDYGKFARRFAQADLVAKFNETLKNLISTNGASDRAHILIMGDYNTVPRDASGKISAVLQRFMNAGFHHANAALPESEFSHRIKDWTSTIDHCFTSPELASRFCNIERANINAGDEAHRLSDHNPTVFAIAPMTLVQEISHTQSLKPAVAAR